MRLTGRIAQLSKGARTGYGNREAEPFLKTLGETGDRAPLPGEHHAADRDGALLSAVVIKRKPELVDEGGDAVLQDLAGRGDRRAVPSYLLDGLLEPDVAEPLRSMLEAEALLGGEARRDRP
jgi:hypothetical protein